ncbi:CinA family protein [Corynebacterium antarcticum]|uniref:CinA family protein n=1 Tax=Corynebacterium antarcticum TaxID=2800405 RepID=UPI0020029E30|nr:CinA family protein [Corynebacterium antarcticum]MCK7660282.1 CinA family protein [Corynebacterium antarcticum]MCX7491221.1 CinA family protein [Corynebacterium antarcticum]MCX7539596.1 CinA family protein [Corynebacterium antarcticum]
MKAADLEALAAEVVAALSARGQTVAFCESLTAGLASASLARVPGASAVLRGGLVTYATDLKISLAGVPQDLVARHGVISPDCAEAMAVGARDRCSASWGVGLTGVAGPDSQEGHPVGEVWIGLAFPDGGVAASRAAGSGPEGGLLSGNREAIRAAAVSEALRGLLRAAVSGDMGIPGPERPVQCPVGTVPEEREQNR